MKQQLVIKLHNFLPSLIITCFLGLIPITTAVSQKEELDSLKNGLINAYDDSIKLVYTRALTWKYLYSNLDSAKYYASIFEEVSKNQSTILQAEALKLIGVVHHVGGDRISAIKYYEGCLFIAKKNGFKDMQANVLANLGDAYSTLGNYPKSIEIYQKSLELDQKSGNKKGVYSGNRRIGIAYQRMNEPEKALEYFSKSLKMEDELNDPSEMASLMNAIAYSLLEVNQIDSAMANHQRALTYYRQNDEHKFLEILTLIYIGQAHVKIGKPKGSLTYLKEAHQLSQLHNYTVGLRDASCELAGAYLSLGENEKALPYLDVAFNLAIETKTEEGLKNALLNKIKAEKAFGNYKEALALTNQLTQLNDSLFSKDKLMRIGALELEHKFKQEKDSITFAQEKQVLAFKAEQSKDVLIRTSIIIILAITVLFLINYYRLYKKGHKKSVALRQANTKIQNTLKELKSTQNLLVQNEKLAALGVLASGVGHEINNPLNFIKKGVELIEKKIQKIGSDHEKFVKDFSIVNDGIDRITRIVSGLRDYNRQGARFDQECKVLDILNNCIEIVKSSNSLLLVKTSYPSDEVMIRGNEGKLHQLFLNLLMNASQANEGEGMVELVVNVNGDQCEIKVIDHGCGMSQAVLKKLGEPFFTTKEPGKGTGLGLYISFDIVRKHSGTYEIISKENIGTTVKLIFSILK